jgi:hypothetical protein
VSPQRPGGPLEVSELRERLRALGYLDAGLDRFVLAPARDERGTLALAWRVSVRIGILAGVLLGPAGAIGIASRLPALVSGPRDALVITAYLALLFGGVAAIAAFAAALGVRAVARRTPPAASRRLAVAAGVVIAAGCLAYLTLWWGTAAGAVWSSPLRTIVALLAAVAISLTLGHAVTLSALALLAREDQGGATLSAPSTSWRLVLVVGFLAFAGAAALLALPAIHPDGRPDRTPAFAVVPTGVKVLVVGIDGFDPALFGQMDATAVPTLRLLAQRAVRVQGPVDRDPARVWTTVATGMAAEDHGVTGLALRRVAGVHGSLEGGDQSPVARAVGAVTDLVRLTRPSPVSGMIRRHKTMWEVAAEKGLRAAVINWWASWPATRTAALVISDRAVLRLERGGAQNAEIAPDLLYEPLRAKWPQIVAQATTRAAAVRTDLDEVNRLLERSATLDAEQVLLARDPLVGDPDLLAVYLPGLDIAQHALLEDGETRSASALLVRLDALRRYYAFLDTLVTDLLAGQPAETSILLVTHPGRAGGAAQPTIAISGAHAAPEIVDPPVTLKDVAPTVLQLLGLPVSRELAGEPLLALLDPAFVGRHPVREVETYGRYAADPPVAEGVPLDEEMMERLRSLGYIR